MIEDAMQKGVNIVISSQTPTNPYENSVTIVDSPPRMSYFSLTWFVCCNLRVIILQFVGYAKHVAACKVIQ
jgi:hypothetical protein